MKRMKKIALILVVALFSNLASLTSSFVLTNIVKSHNLSIFASKSNGTLTKMSLETLFLICFFRAQGYFLFEKIPPHKNMFN